MAEMKWSAGSWEPLIVPLWEAQEGGSLSGTQSRGEPATLHG